VYDWRQALVGVLIVATGLPVYLLVRRFTRAAAILVCVCAGLALGCARTAERGVVLDDVHSRLNETTVREFHEPRTKGELLDLVRRARRMGLPISISGGRHAMGGQQFGSGTMHVNLSRYARVLALDAEHGRVTVESGIQWPELVRWLNDEQRGRERVWTIRQKQTGADRLSVGGALSANVHGRGLTLRPIVDDVESFELIDGAGTLRRCSRGQEPELFRLAIGGYGLFGVITEVTLRLTPRVKLEREVSIVARDELPRLVEQRISEGYLYGDWQFKTDERAQDFLETGVFSCYRPVADDTPLTAAPRTLSEAQWIELYQLAHLDKSRAFHLYADFYLGTDGQVYWSDAQQLSYYVQGYDEVVDRARGARAPGSLMITELYVPRPRLPEFLREAARVLRQEQADLVYGTVRWIERDGESFLAWARESFACTVLNLRVTHDETGLAAAARQFQALIDAALAADGSYFLTYHRWARQDQLLAAYPQFPEFLRLKRHYDPGERFQSDWYRHYRKMFAE
jgi:FAD/FMN-containing dehydrogenase